MVTGTTVNALTVRGAMRSRRISKLVGVLVVLASLAAVAGVSPRVASVEATTGSGGCVGLAPRAAGTRQGTFVHHGIRRTYQLHLSPGYDPTRRTPVVVLLHGQGSYGLQQLLYSNYRTLADREGIIVVAPDTAYPVFDRWVADGGPGASPQSVDDVGFITRLLTRMEANLCVDEDRVFATGISSGAFMASHLACHLPDRIAAVATVAGTVVDSAEVCQTARPVPVLAFHGSADRNVPYGSQTFGRDCPDDGVLPQVRQWAVRRNGCLDTSRLTQLARDVSVRSWSCPPSGATKLVRIQGGGHTWPGAPFEVPSLGPTTQSVSATAMGWRFFERHPRG